MASPFRGLVWVLALVLGGTCFGLTPEELKAHAPPQALQEKLDAFFKKHGEAFKIQGQDQLTRAFHQVKRASDLVGLVDKAKADQEGPYMLLGEQLAKAGCTILKNDEKTLVFSSPELGDCVVKVPGWLYRPWNGERQHNLRRLDGALALRECVEAHRFGPYLQVPEKFAYHLPWREKALNDANYIVVAAKVDTGDPGDALANPANPMAVLALLTAVTETGMNDLALFNIHITGEGNLVVLDTEDFFTFTPETIRAFCADRVEEVSSLSATLCDFALGGDPEQLGNMVGIFKKLYAALVTIPRFRSVLGRSSVELVEAFEAELKEDVRGWPGPPLPDLAKNLRKLLHHDRLLDSELQ